MIKKRRTKGKVASPITEILRREVHSHNRHKTYLRTRSTYPKVRRRKRICKCGHGIEFHRHDDTSCLVLDCDCKGFSENLQGKRRTGKEKEKVFKLFKNGWKINWIAKELNMDWHSVKMIVDKDYAEKRRQISRKRMKMILADPIERKKQFARVDKWKKERLENDPRMRRWTRYVNKRAGRKWDRAHREERRVSAIKRYNEKMGELCNK